MLRTCMSEFENFRKLDNLHFKTLESLEGTYITFDIDKVCKQVLLLKSTAGLCDPRLT